MNRIHDVEFLVAGEEHPNLVITDMPPEMKRKLVPLRDELTEFVKFTEKYHRLGIVLGFSFLIFGAITLVFAPQSEAKIMGGGSIVAGLCVLFEK